MRTEDKILEVAQSLLRQKGFNAFSYADISKEVGIRKASIHYYYPSKSDLGLALVDSYKTSLKEELAKLDQEGGSPEERLKAFSQMYKSGLKEDKLCLCGMLASDFCGLDAPVQEAVKDFYSLLENWMSKLLEEGVKKKSWKLKSSVEVETRKVLSFLLGAQLLSRMHGKSGCTYYFDTLTQELLN